MPESKLRPVMTRHSEQPVLCPSGLMHLSAVLRGMEDKGSLWG